MYYRTHYTRCATQIATDQKLCVLRHTRKEIMKFKNFLMVSFASFSLLLTGCGNNNETTPSAHEHTWSDPTYVWSADYLTCKAERVCKEDATHKESETVASTYTVVTPATCLDDGVGKYSVVFENKAFVAQSKNVSITAIGYHEYNPITGHCIHDDCNHTLAIETTVDYGDGILNTRRTSSEDYIRDEKRIYDITFKGTAASTNLNIGFVKDESTGIFKSNCNLVVYDEDYNVLELNAFSGYAFYALEHNFVNGEHIYVHVTMKSSDFTNVSMSLTTHQYTGLKAVARKFKTCVSPTINAHLDFDQSSTTSTWLTTTGEEEKLQSSFYVGSAGTGHTLTHYDASAATTTSPALKEHWYCSNCGCYFLSSEGGEEVEYEDLYANTIYGNILTTGNISGRGVVVKVRVTVDKGETPIENTDTRYVGATCNVIFADESISENFVITGISVNVHIVEFLLRGVTSYSEFSAKSPTAFYINL